MPLTIADNVLEQAGLSEREMATEIACRLFAARILSKPAAQKLCGLSRPEFEDELVNRGLPVVILDVEYWDQELASLQRLSGS